MMGLGQEPTLRLAPARAPRRFHGERLLLLDPSTQALGDHGIVELPRLLRRGDVLVVNDAATLPASLRVDAELELRLLTREPDGSFRAVTLGAGDHRLATEARGSPRRVQVGERLVFSPTLAATVQHVDPQHPRLLRLRFESEGAALFSALYAHGKPIQYAYASEPLALWDVQNRYASRPWAFELPSAGHPLTFELLFELERRGVALTYVSHAAGVSSTGDAEIDALLPLAEHFEIGAEAASVISSAKARGGRVVAAGTSVVRALEASTDRHGKLEARAGQTSLRLGADYRPRIVSGLLTGMHEPGTSHFELLQAFAPRELLLTATAYAAQVGYLQHEFGDSCLILPQAA